VTSWDVVCSGFFDSIGLYKTITHDHEHLAKEMIAKLGLSDLIFTPDNDHAGNILDWKPSQSRNFYYLSHGQQRLVLLCRAMVKKPELLLLDEPTHGLTGLNRDRLYGILRTLRDSKDVAVVYVTHRQDEIDRLGFTNVLRL